MSELAKKIIEENLKAKAAELSLKQKEAEQLIKEGKSIPEGFLRTTYTSIDLGNCGL